jgi:hypothetical protein
MVLTSHKPCDIIFNNENKQKNTTLSEQFGTSLAWYRSFNVNEENVPSFTSKYTMLAIIL